MQSSSSMTNNLFEDGLYDDSTPTPMPVPTSTPCPRGDGSCPIRSAMKQIEGGLEKSADPVIVGGGLRDCCDVVMANARFYITRRTLEHARGIEPSPAVEKSDVVQGIYKEFAVITARMFARAIDAIDIAEMAAADALEGDNPRTGCTVKCVELAQGMDIPTMRVNLAAIHGASKSPIDPPPELVTPPPPSAATTTPFDDEMAAANYAFALEQEHAKVCQWLSMFIQKSNVLSSE